MMKKIGLVVATSALAASCGAIGPAGGLFTSVKGPRSFQAGPSNNPGMNTITGESCAMSILGLIALGDWSVDAALKAAGAEGKSLKNVAVDSRVMSILGLYGNYCTDIAAQVAEDGMAAAPAPAPVEEEVVEAPPEPAGRQLPTGHTVNTGDGSMEYGLLDFIQDEDRAVDKTTWFNFDRISFATGSAKLDMDKSSDQLNEIAEILKAYPAVKLKVGGYTDNTGKAKANQKLSAARAKAVAAALTDRGIDKKRLDPEGYGSKHPVCPANDTPECRAQNRRLAVRVTAK